jgi:PTH1 family peptidyl-tRNA hydrolase
MKLIVGLGNPGLKYVGTRHNVGYDVLARLAHEYGAESVRLRFEAEITEITVATERLLLVAPQTFMNLSGRSVRQVVDFYKLVLPDLLLVCDDLNLDVGRLRLRASGSAGGQKGLQNTIDHLGTEQFARLRIGIGRPPGRMDSAAYVLQKPRPDERENLELAVVRAADAVVLWAKQGIEAAMNVVNAPTGTAAGGQAGKHDSE